MAKSSSSAVERDCYIEAKRVNEVDRTVPSVCVEVDACFEGNRVLADKFANRRVVVSGAVVRSDAIPAGKGERA
jgi:hypothetical protein